VPAAAEKPDVLILDEPTNHLDAESVQWLEQHLKRYEGTVIAVTHDRYFLDNVAGWILELDRGAGHSLQGQLHRLAGAEADRLRSRRRPSRPARRCSPRAGVGAASPRARQAKSKARLQNYEKLLNQDTKGKETEIEIVIPPGPRLGELVIKADKISKSYGDKLLFQNCRSASRPAGSSASSARTGRQDDAVPHDHRPGAAGRRQADDRPERAAGVRRAEPRDAERRRDGLAGDRRRAGHVPARRGERLRRHADERPGVRQPVRVQRPDQQKKVGVLSGGERNRLHLARMLKSGANVILLDEPTNDLDVNTIRALEEALENFAGCAVVVSHDRWFLDRLATHILAFEGDSQVCGTRGTSRRTRRTRRSGSGRTRPAAPGEVPEIDEVSDAPATDR
jgi:ATPase subunit of ABC transporter with duplicated ATPase domains